MTVLFAVHWNSPAHATDHPACGQAFWSRMVTGKPKRVVDDVTCGKCLAIVKEAISLIVTLKRRDPANGS